MRTVVIGIPLVAALIIGCQGCSSQSTNQLEGTWDLVEAKCSPPDPNFNFADWHQIKILTKTHWAFLSEKRVAPKMTSATNDAELLPQRKHLRQAEEPIRWTAIRTRSISTSSTRRPTSGRRFNGRYGGKATS